MTAHLPASDAWEALRIHRQEIAALRLSDVFCADPGRASRLRLQAAGLTLDYSKNIVTDTSMELLVALASCCKVDELRHAMLQGAAINHTEGRAVLHTLLRGSDDGEPLPQFSEVRDTRLRMTAICAQLRAGDWPGWSGQPVCDVVNIGIGGSHLGPAFVTEALGHLAGDAPRCHFVSNVDPRDLERTVAGLDPRSTLFIVASKTFSTLETLENAASARRWLVAGGCPQSHLDRHFIAVSANVAAAVEFGIGANNVLPMWDWVGGRYSLWSAIGLPIALAVGMPQFEGLLLGAHRMDMHFRDAPLQQNMPVLLALLSVWYRNFWATASHAVIPYDQSLARLPEYLQQLVMESNGKSVDREGVALTRASSGVIWGAAGTNGQHSFHQLLHQGSDVIPVDFILPLVSHSANRSQHAWLVANCIAQSQALMIGRSLQEAQAELRTRGVNEAKIATLAPHRVMPGNRPSNTIAMDKLTAETLGALLALYEHRTAVEGFIWNLNSFDQFGVELGKRLGEDVHRMLTSARAADDSVDSSTRQLVEMYRAQTPR